MFICRTDDYKTCHKYDLEEKPPVELRKIERGKVLETTFFSNQIACILEGEIHCSPYGNPGGILRKEQLVFLPAGDKMQYKTHANSTVLLFRPNRNIELCRHFSIERLYSKMKEIEKPEALVVLEVNPRLLYFVNGLTNILEDGLKCCFYLQTEVTRLLNMLRIYYSEEQLCRFFYSILSPDAAFSEHVRTLHLEYHSVKKLANAMNMTPPQFTKRFHNVFGHTPHEWMKHEKARLIYGEVCKNDKSLKEIAFEYGFTAQANFSRFCKTEFNISPGKLRKKYSKTHSDN